MSGIQNFPIFLLASLTLNLIPGPDTFYILGRSMAQGRSVGIASAFGISAGTVVHTFAAAFGLSALIAASATAFVAVKLAGAAYLVFLGLRLLSSRPPVDSPPITFDQSGFLVAFRQGLITNVLNPKVALFFLAFLPQFIAAESSSRFLAFLFLGFCFVTTSMTWCLILAWFSSALGSRLRSHPKSLQYLNRATGTLLVGLGVHLATAKTH